MLIKGGENLSTFNYLQRFSILLFTLVFIEQT